MFHNSGVPDASVVICVDAFVIAAVCGSLDITVDSSATCAGDAVVVVFAVVPVDAADDTPGHGAAHDAVHVAVLLQFGDALKTVLVGQEGCWLRFFRKSPAAASHPQLIRLRSTQDLPSPWGGQDAGGMRLLVRMGIAREKRMEKQSVLHLVEQPIATTAVAMVAPRANLVPEGKSICRICVRQRRQLVRCHTSKGTAVQEYYTPEYMEAAHVATIATSVFSRPSRCLPSEAP